MSSNDRCREAAALIRNGYAYLNIRICQEVEFHSSSPVDSARLDDDFLADALDDAAEYGHGHWATLARSILGAWRGAGCPGKTADFDPRDWEGDR